MIYYIIGSYIFMFGASSVSEEKEDFTSFKVFIFLLLSPITSLLLFGRAVGKILFKIEEK
jgi:hypothetical protein